MDYHEDIKYQFPESSSLLHSLDSNMELFVKSNTFDVLSFYESGLLKLFFLVCKYVKSECSDVDVLKLDILNYLDLRNIYYSFSTSSDYFSHILYTVKKHNDELLLGDIFEDFHFSLKTEDLKDNEYNYFANQLKAIQLNTDSFLQSIDTIIELYNRLSDKVFNTLRYIDEELRYDDEMPDFVVSEFRRFATEEKYEFPKKLRNAALKLKSNRLEELSKLQWARLAELDNELVNKIIDGTSFEYNAYKDLYSRYEIDEMMREKKILALLQENSNPEDLFDLKALCLSCNLWDRYLNRYNVYFFFARIHIENLIKCELYDGLAEQYHQFLYGSDEKDEATEAAPQVPAKTNTESSAASDGPINKRIDVAKLIGFIRSYTDGQYKSNYFKKKSYWISIYIVLRQSLEQLDGSPIFLPASRPKFAEWVNANIRPESVPCDKSSLDTAPSYFRDEKNYPWDIDGFYMAGFTQEKTFNSYSMVADYFQKNLIEKLQDFMIPTDKGSETY